MSDQLPAELQDALAALDDNERLGEESLTLEDLVTRMLRARDMVDGLEAQLKTARAELDDLRKKQLPEKMMELGLVTGEGKGSFSHSSGAKVHLSTRLWASIRAEERDNAYTWLRENGHGDIIKETINANTLSVFAKERIEDGEPLPPGVVTTVETMAVLVRPKGEKA